MKKEVINKKKYVKNIKGVTLIALVITIAVLIILSVVSIKGILDQRGITKEAKKASDMTENAVIQEDEDVTDIMDEYYTEMSTLDWNLDKVTAVKSEDNILVPVPIGYTASTVAGEKSVATGFVIKEGSNGAATSGINEFVWVPVANISDIYDAEHNAGQLWDFNGTTSTKMAYPTTQNSGYREPDVVTGASSGSDSASGIGYDAFSTNLQQAGLSSTATVNDFKKQLQSEFNEMIESVRKYGGFYIGRYETGNLNSTKPVVQKGNTDINNQTWYTMYKLSKTIEANSNVTTSMIWGCQWDATMRWLQTSTDEKVKNFPINSSAYGNYYDNSISYVDTDGTTKTTTSNSGTKIPTGSAEITKINNIYDMAGNVYDLTIEACYINSRTERGGYYSSIIPSGNYNASGRGGLNPANIGAGNGVRVSLYVK